MKKKSKIIVIISVLIISIIIFVILDVFYFPFYNYYKIEKGMTESEVRDLLGEPKSDHKFRMGEPFMGHHPDLPNGTEFREWNYFIKDQRIGIIFISPNDYSNITGEETLGNEWRVIKKYMVSKYIVY